MGINQLGHTHLGCIIQNDNIGGTRDTLVKELQVIPLLMSPCIAGRHDSNYVTMETHVLRQFF